MFFTYAIIKVKAANGDNVGKVSSTTESVERADRVSTFGSSRQWADPSIKVNSNVSSPSFSDANTSIFSGGNK